MISDHEQIIITPGKIDLPIPLLEFPEIKKNCST
jgi:hypothetical protein